MKTPEYHEGPEALERFGKTMTALFRAPKTVITKKETKRKTRKRRTCQQGPTFSPASPLPPPKQTGAAKARRDRA